MSQIWALFSSLPFASHLFGLYLTDTGIVKDGLAVEHGSMTVEAFFVAHQGTLDAVAEILAVPANWQALVAAVGGAAPVGSSAPVRTLEDALSQALAPRVS